MYEDGQPHRWKTAAMCPQARSSSSIAATSASFTATRRWRILFSSFARLNPLRYLNTSRRKHCICMSAVCRTSVILISFVLAFFNSLVIATICLARAVPLLFGWNDCSSPYTALISC